MFFEALLLVIFSEPLFKKVDFDLKLLNLVFEGFYFVLIQGLGLYSFFAFLYLLSVGFYDCRDFLDIRHELVVLFLALLFVL